MDPHMDVNVICMKWGTKYDPHYVNRLYAMVKRNLTLPFRFVCFTDDRTGIREEVDVLPLPSMDLPEGIPERGWNKLATFGEQLGDLEGKAIFLDLDVVIVDNMDCFFDDQREFSIIKDYHRRNAARSIGNSSVYRFEIGRHPEVLDYFRHNFDQVRATHRNEQAYWSDQMKQKGVLQFWPESWCPSFKHHCIPRGPMSLLREPTCPDGAKIVVFHGDPNPPEAIEGRRSKFMRFMRPTPWIKNYWRE
jgi:hypothetical protein